MLGLAAGLTGYSLPDDLLSGTGLRIIYSVILAIPFVGERLVYLIFGGEWPGTDIIGRLYPVHILLIPGAHRACSSRCTWRWSGGRSTPSSVGRDEPSTTSSECGCGPPSR